MPAEWEPHESTWIAWPHNRTDWPGKFQTIPWVYAEIVRHLSRVECVDILVQDEREEARAARVLKLSDARMESVRFHRWPTNRVWTRDYGPIFVSNREELGAVKWRFNAWAKYPDWRLDERAGSKIVASVKVPGWRPVAVLHGRQQPLVLEGGSIDVNGQGTLLTTEECLLSEVQARNPGLGREGMEMALREYLGAQQVVWLGRGIAGDDTHGHVDDIARFVSPQMVVAVVETNRDDPNHEPLADNVRRLRAAADQDGRRLTVIELPMPEPVTFRGLRLPASYANFYIANGLLLVPTFNDRNDRVALEILAGCFPDREVVGIHCRDLVLGLGTLHCLTQQQPKV